MHLVNQFGRVVEILDQDQADKMLAKKVMRMALPHEIEAKEKQRREMAARAAESAGAGVFYSTIQSSPDGYGMSRDIIKTELFSQGIYLSENFSEQKVGLVYNYPYPLANLRTPIKLIYTMFESDKLPEDWAAYLKKADEVLVPSAWCQKIFAKSGIRTTVVPLGYNDDKFQYIDRPVPVEVDGTFTFIHYNSFNMRKGFSEVLEAFSEEFSTTEPVRLILKTTRESLPVPFIQEQYPNITVMRGTVSESELSDILGKANCMVYPSKGEGFGITPLEAMATGLPAIVPNAHGISHYFDPKFMLEVKVAEMVPALYNKFKGQDTGNMVQCDVDDLRRQMRYAFNHQREMKQLGKNASEYVKRFTYKGTAVELAKILNKWIQAPIQKKPESDILDVEVY